MRQISFETTGLAFQDQKASNLTGLQRGEIGADLQKSAAERLCASVPVETNRNLEVALTQRYGLSKKLRGVVMVGEPDYAVVPVRDGHDYQAAYDAVRLAMVPAPDGVIAKAIGVLEAKCKRGKESDGAGDIGLKVFVSELRKYPADVVLAVLNNWGDRNTFAPSWHELKTELDRMTQGRRNLLAALEWSNGKTFKEIEPLEQPSGKSWQEAPMLEKPVQPPRLSKEEMAARLCSMMDLVDAHQKTPQQLTEM